MLLKTVLALIFLPSLSVHAQTLQSFQLAPATLIEPTIELLNPITSTEEDRGENTAIFDPSDISAQNTIDATNLQTIPSFTPERFAYVKQTALRTAEGNAKTTKLQIPVVIEGDFVADETLTLTYQTIAGSASEGKDYVTISAGKATYTVGSNPSKNITLSAYVDVIGDNTFEKDETFTLRLNAIESSSSETILFDEATFIDIDIIIENDDTNIERIDTTSIIPTATEPADDLKKQDVPEATIANDQNPPLSQQENADIDATVNMNEDPDSLSQQEFPDVSIPRVQIQLRRQDLPELSVPTVVSTSLQEQDADEASANKEDAPDSKQPSPLSSITPSLVKTVDDLSTFANDILTRDMDVNDVSVENTEVSVTYNKPTKLLGFISTKLKETVTVKTDGSVEVSRPWWAIFSRDGESTKEAKEDVLKRVTGVLTKDSTEEAPTVLANILGAIDTSLKIRSGKATNFDVFDLNNTSGDILSALPSNDDVLVSDLDALIRAAFIGSSAERANADSSSYMFIDLALQGMFGSVGSQGLSLMQATARSGGDDIVAGINRTYEYLDNRGITYQRDLFFRTALELELTRALAGDTAAQAFIQAHIGDMSTIFAEQGITLLTDTGSAYTMVRFPLCEAGVVSGCVDVAQLLRSHTDPRSLSSLCAPGTMVLQGNLEIDGLTRYGCPPPSGVCTALTGNTTDASGGYNLSLNGQEPSSQTSAIADARSFFSEQGLTAGQGQDVCGAHLAAATAMPVGSAQCIAEAISQIAQEDLLGATGFAGCMAVQLGLNLGADPAIDRVIDTALNDAGCGISAEAAAPASTENTDAKDPKKEPVKKDTPDTKPESQEGYSKNAKGQHVITKNKEAGGQLVMTITSLGGASIANTGGTTPTQDDFAGLAELVQDIVPYLDFGSQDLADTITGGAIGKIRQDSANLALFQEFGKSGGAQLGGEACSEAMQALQGAFDKCAGDVASQVATGIGAGSQGAGRIDQTVPGSNPFGGRPGEYGGSADVDPITACMQQNSARTHGSRNEPSNGGMCGFVVCADGTDNCCAGTNLNDRQAAGEALRDLRDCAEVICAFGESCRCAGEGGTDEPPENIIPEDGGVNPIARGASTVSNMIGRMGNFLRDVFGR